MVQPAAAGSGPASLPSGAAKVLDGYEIAWAGTLKKAARFTISYAGATPAPGTIALYRSADGTSWERLGGTVDDAAKSLSLAVNQPGRYALYADNGAGSGTASLSAVAFTPRVFSPTGGFADTQVGISFSLGKPAAVTVKVYSRSGRLIPRGGHGGATERRRQHDPLGWPGPQRWVRSGRDVSRHRRGPGTYRNQDTGGGEVEILQPRMSCKSKGAGSRDPAPSCSEANRCPLCGRGLST